MKQSTSIKHGGQRAVISLNTEILKVIVQDDVDLKVSNTSEKWRQFRSCKINQSSWMY